MFGKEKAKIYISCCSNRNPEWATVLSIQDAMRHAATKGYTTSFPPRSGDSLIDRARNDDLVEFMRRGGYDLLFSVDDDVAIPPDTLVKLAEADKDIVAGIYRLKVDNPVAAVRLPIEGPSWGQVLSDGLLTPAIYVSTGCFMVKRKVVEGMIEEFRKLRDSKYLKTSRFDPNISDEEFLKMTRKIIAAELEYKRNVHADKAWAFYMPYIYEEEYLSEDWAFCQRARDAGFQVWVHGDVKCAHWGKKMFVWGE